MKMNRSPHPGGRSGRRSPALAAIRYERVDCGVYELMLTSLYTTCSWCCLSLACPAWLPLGGRADCRLWNTAQLPANSGMFACLMQDIKTPLRCSKIAARWIRVPVKG